MELDHFFPLQDIHFIKHAFTTRLCTPKMESHAENPEILNNLFSVPVSWKFAHQIHGNKIAILDSRSPTFSEQTDALCTKQPNIALGISVADCCAIYIVDLRQRAIALVHSGKKGTELNILSTTVTTMQSHFQSQPNDLLVQLSPCIRPPYYETDFVSTIHKQAYELGIQSVYDCRICTGSNLNRYYSYRIEKGQTGRMLAAIMLK